MCTIFVAPKMRTGLSADAVCYQDVKFKRRKLTEDRKRQLSMKWVVVTDEDGSPRLQMRWTVARSPVPPTSQCVQPCDGPGERSNSRPGGTSNDFLISLRLGT